MIASRNRLQLADRKRSLLAMAALMSAVASFTLLQSLILPALGPIREEFETDQVTVSWLLTAYLISAAICTPLLGRLGDALGRRRVLIGALGALAVGSAGAALAPSIEWLIVARILQGLGGGVMPLSVAMVRDVIAPKRVAAAVGVLASTAPIGFSVGLVAGGPIVNRLGHEWLFWIPLGTTVIALLGVLRMPPPRHSAAGPSGLPLGQALFLALGLSGVLVAVAQGENWGWTSRGTVLAFLGGAIFSVVWVVTELRVQRPLVNLSLMRVRAVWVSNCVSACVGFGLFASVVFLPQMLQAPENLAYGFGATPGESGIALLPSSVLAFLVGFTATGLARRVSLRAVFVAGCLASATGFVLMAVLNDALWQVLIATAVHGLGSGLLFATMANAIVASVDQSWSAAAVSLNYNLRMIGGSFGTAVMAAVVAQGATSSGWPHQAAYVAGFGMLAAVMVIAALVSLFMRVDSVDAATPG